MRRLVLILILLFTPTSCWAVTYAGEYCGFTGADAPGILTTGYFYPHLYGGVQVLMVAPDGCAFYPNGIAVFSSGASLNGNYLMPYTLVYTMPSGSSTVTDVSATALDAHEGIGDTTVLGNSGDSIIVGADFIPDYMQWQPGTLATPGATAFIRWQYASSTGWKNVDTGPGTTGANVGLPHQIDTASSATACASNYCFDVAGVHSSGVVANGNYAWAGSPANKANTLELFATSQTCPTAGTPCWIPSDFVKVDLTASPYSLTGASSTKRWYVRALVAGANFTTMPANMLAQVIEVGSPMIATIKRYGGSGATSLAGLLTGAGGTGPATAQIKQFNDIVPSLVNAGVNSTAEGLIPSTLVGDGSITTTPATAVEQNFTLSEWAMGRSGQSPTTYGASPIKDLGTNPGNSSANGVACGNNVVVHGPDAYDPNMTTAYTGAANLEFGQAPYTGNGGAVNRNGVLIWGIEPEELDFTPGIDNMTHTQLGLEILSMDAVGAVYSGYAPTPAAGQFANYTKLAWRDFELNRYFCTAASTPLACCTANQTGTCTADPTATTLSGGQLSTALAALNSAWKLATPGSPACTGSALTACNTLFSTWNTTDSGGGATGIAAIKNGTYASWGTGTGFLDEDGKRTVLQCGANWFGGVAAYQNWAAGGATNIYNDLLAFITQYANVYQKAVHDGYNVATGGSVPSATRPMLLCSMGAPPDVAVTGMAPYCDAMLMFAGYEASLHNTTFDPASLKVNEQDWENLAYNARLATGTNPNSIPFFDLDFVSANDLPTTMDLKGQTASTNCQITAVSLSGGNTLLTAENCPTLSGWQRGLYSADSPTPSACPFGVDNTGKMIAAPTVTAADWTTTAGTTFTISGNWTAAGCFSVGKHVQMASVTQARPGLAGNASVSVAGGVTDYVTYGSGSAPAAGTEAAGHYLQTKNEIDVADPGGHHDFAGRFVWTLWADPFTSQSSNNAGAGYLDPLGNLVDGVEDTSAGGCSSIVGTCSNAQCIDPAYKNSSVLCDPSGYPTGGDAGQLAIFANAADFGNRIGPPCTLAATDACGIDLNAIQYMIINDPIGSAPGIQTNLTNPTQPWMY